MSDLKVGDLCIVINASVLIENIGKSCELIQYVEAGEIYKHRRGRRTEAQAAGWVIAGEGIVGRVLRGGKEVLTKGYGQARPEWLMKIGDKEPERVKLAKESVS